MNIKTSKNNINSFFDIYISEISPKIKLIDVFLQSSESPFEVEEVSNILDISHKETIKIMAVENITEISKSNFFKIMLKGSSYICKLFKREIDCGSPTLYTAYDVSYIYGIDESKIENAYRFLNIQFATESMLPAIFTQIRLR